MPPAPEQPKTPASTVSFSELLERSGAQKDVTTAAGSTTAGEAETPPQPDGNAATTSKAEARRDSPESEPQKRPKLRETAKDVQNHPDDADDTAPVTLKSPVWPDTPRAAESARSKQAGVRAHANDGLPDDRDETVADTDAHVAQATHAGEAGQTKDPRPTAKRDRVVSFGNLAADDGAVDDTPATAGADAGPRAKGPRVLAAQSSDSRRGTDRVGAGDAPGTQSANTVVRASRKGTSDARDKARVGEKLDQAAAAPARTEAGDATLQDSTRSDRAGNVVELAVRLDATAGEADAPRTNATRFVEAGGQLARRLNGDLGDQIVRQARVVLTNHDSGEIRLVIRPPELGRVRIRLEMESGRIAGRILVDNATVREVVERSLPSLERAFSNAGLEVGEFGVATGGPEEGSAHSQTQEGPTAGERSSSTTEVLAPPSGVAYGYDHHLVNLVA